MTAQITDEIMQQQHAMLTMKTVMTNLWTVSSSSKYSVPEHGSLMSENANIKENT